jgi:CheY-like chemotaxis protein
MRGLIEWLCVVEELAAQVYAEAGAQFADNLGLAEFLRHMAADERVHLAYVRQLAETVPRISLPVADVSLDPETRDRIEGPLRRGLGDLARREATLGDILDLVVEVEFAETNHIFLYVMRAFQRDPTAIQRMQDAFEEHEARARAFLATLPDGRAAAARLSTLPAPFARHYLIVDDNESMRQLFKAIFEDAVVVGAANGVEGLERVAGQSFDVIVSDVEMPAMDGLEFVRRVVERQAELASRIILWSGRITDEMASFGREWRIPILQKPVSLGNLRHAVEARRNQPG